MALTSDQKALLAGKYAPVLFFHKDEKFVPIRPEAYIRRAALWESRPDLDDKSKWGLDQQSFPRRPTIPKFGISVDPTQDFEGTSDPDNDGVNEYYLGHKRVGAEGDFPYLQSTSQRNLWLESSGWQDSVEVTATSVNDHCNRDAAEEKWREPAEAFAPTFSYWYYAEVYEMSDLERFLTTVNLIGDDSIETTIRKAAGDMIVIFYYFLYPVHEEYLRRCEQVIDTSKRGDYEGDWNAVAVVLQQPLVLPWEPGGHFEDPLYVAHGIRLRGLGEEFTPDALSQGMLVTPWSDVRRLVDSLHPRVFVTKGYHNNYPQPYDSPPKDPLLLGTQLTKITCEVVEEFDEILQDIKEDIDDVGETIKDIAITVAKAAAGAQIGGKIAGPFGAGIGTIAGAVAGLLEGLASSNTNDVPSEDIRKGLESEPGPGEPHYGLVITPPDLPNPLRPADPQHPEATESATKIVTWQGSDLDKLVDRREQIWWPDAPGTRGYNGRWGVRVTSDPNNRRSGIPFPNFIQSLLNDMALQISKLPPG